MAEPKTQLTEDLAVLKPFLETTERNYLWGHELATKTQEHTDKMLTWSIGLMGGGLYGAHTLLKCGPPHVWLWAILPWLLGILSALAGRVIIAQFLKVGGRWNPQARDSATAPHARKRWAPDKQAPDGAPFPY